ncbi:unnamed protein product [Aureobasidium mustum]|uniref:Ribosomal protein 60S n=1 Tax=Aureobasidium mustum TaxID=2773714 RepID=A0A9N8JFW5_9PEZI|nr:unnamed protein product [Aureobasidium mustum]
MKYLAAYLLLNLAGNESPSAEDIKSVLSSVGVDAEGERLDKLISELEGKNIQEVRIHTTNCKIFSQAQYLHHTQLISEGSAKLASVPSGGAAAAGGAAPAAGAAAEAAPAEEKAEEKEESDDDMGFGLFD